LRAKNRNSIFPKGLLAFVVAIALLVFETSMSRAQGTLYISNLGEPGSGFSVGGGSQSFQTGVASNGYILNSITLLMGDWLGNASNFVVSINSDNSGQPGTILANLSGNGDPETAGQYVYAASSLTLNSNTTYWIQATCDSSSLGPLFPPGGYAWQITTSPNYTSADGWNTSGVGNSVGNGWLLQFGVSATAVPESNSSALTVLGLVVFAFWRRYVYRN
jgi:hypothetical protein